MSAQKMTIIRGDDYNQLMTFTSGGVAYNLTGCTVFFTVKSPDKLKDVDDTNAVISKTITIHSDPTHGKTYLVLTATQTAVPTGTYTYDLQIKTVGGEIHSSLRGVCLIVDDVTKRIV